MPHIMKFGKENFKFAGIATTKNQLKLIEVKLIKDGYSFRCSFDGAKWDCWKRKKHNFRVNKVDQGSRHLIP